MRLRTLAILTGVIFLNGNLIVKSQEYGPPDRDQPGDEMIQAYLARQTETIHERFMENVKSVEDWKKLRPQYKEEYFYMLGLAPMPEKTPLKATITGTLQGDGYVVDMLHYQSRPKLYVTGNLYRPQNAAKGQRLPAGELPTRRGRAFLLLEHDRQVPDLLHGHAGALRNHGHGFPIAAEDLDREAGARESADGQRVLRQHRGGDAGLAGGGLCDDSTVGADWGAVCGGRGQSAVGRVAGVVGHAPGGSGDGRGGGGRVAGGNIPVGNERSDA